MGLFDVVVTVVVLLGIAVAILLFERRRAEEIRRDLGAEARRRTSPEQSDRSDLPDQPDRPDQRDD